MTRVKRVFSYDTPYGQSNKNIRTLKIIALHTSLYIEGLSNFVPKLVKTYATRKYGA